MPGKFPETFEYIKMQSSEVTKPTGAGAGWEHRLLRDDYKSRRARRQSRGPPRGGGGKLQLPACPARARAVAPSQDGGAGGRQRVGPPLPAAFLRGPAHLSSPPAPGPGNPVRSTGRGRSQGRGLGGGSHGRAAADGARGGEAPGGAERSPARGMATLQPLGKPPRTRRRRLRRCRRPAGRQRCGSSRPPALRGSALRLPLLALGLPFGLGEAQTRTSNTRFLLPPLRFWERNNVTREKGRTRLLPPGKPGLPSRREERRPKAYLHSTWVHSENHERLDKCKICRTGTKSKRSQMTKLNII
ncbi:translation initiation factor IF-2-like [Aquila chrysaetos chrysaetos]|uniref:translation initiation factor IF-2-like n=1 Tax=Aquila chrysaetos chrysaetos TaxID=223781 RepID=UPI001B7D2FE2|nr:translation initiation factor IF-2-like [Aquila chrysaetos chrysaetos]